MAPRPLAAACLAEAAGTFLLVFLGCGSVHVAVLTGELAGLWQVAIVWGIAVMLAIYVFGPISGAHINPAITCGLATWGMFPKTRVAPYVASQVLGAFIAAAVLFGMFHSHLTAKEQSKRIVRGQPGSEMTAMCYGAFFPSPGRLASGSDTYDRATQEELNSMVAQPAAWMAEMIGTALLALVVVTLTDPRNSNGSRTLAPVLIGLTITALICVISPLTQASFNPARDFGPRLFAYLAGWGSIAIPGQHEWAMLNVYLVAPTLGAMAGAGLSQCILRYHFLSSTVGESRDVPSIPVTLTRSSRPADCDGNDCQRLWTVPTRPRRAAP